jgi:hypothetical protein
LVAWTVTGLPVGGIVPVGVTRGPVCVPLHHDLDGGLEIAGDQADDLPGEVGEGDLEDPHALSRGFGSV